MISHEEARTRVARGAAHLDVVRPGWFNDIDTGTLTLSSGCRCTLGQVFGDYHEGLKAMGWCNYFNGVPDNAPQRTHGFTIGIKPKESPEWMLLQDAWIEAIADRRLSTTVDVQPAVDAVGLSIDQPVAVNART